MHADDRELAHRLFATATAMLEDATVIATAKQSPYIDASKLMDLGERLQAAGRDAAVIAAAAEIVAKRGAEAGEEPPDSSG